MASARQLGLGSGVQLQEWSIRPAPHLPARRVGVNLKRASRQAMRTAAQAQKQASAIAVPKNASEEPSIYFEPFLRSFILGASAGAAFEVIHVASKFFNVVGEVGYGELAQTLPSMRDNFAPVIVNDHIVALGCWFIFYVIEAYAILKVLRQHPQNPAAAAYALRGLSTLPKRMLPRLKPFKNFIQALGLRGHVQTPASSHQSSEVLASSATVAPKPPPRKQIRPFPPYADPQQEPEGPLPQEGTLQERRAARKLRPGQLDSTTQALLNRQKELSSRRCYLRNFWYAVGISEQIKDKPVGVEILGEKVVLFRDLSGKVNCLQDVCPHRGAPLHRGWVSHVKQHECIVCPYHGWAFDANGVLRDVPAHESSHEWPTKPLVSSFPVQEKGGFVWLFYGSSDLPEEERPPIPYVPELEDPQWKPVYGEIEFECSHWGVFENAIDMAHIHYLHSDSFGNEEKPQINSMTCSSDAYGINADFALHNKPVNAFWNFSKVSEVKVNAKALLPSTSVISFTLGRGLSFTTFVNTVPISATKTVNRFALIRRLDVDPIGSAVFNLQAWDSLARQAMIKILQQDKAMVENLLPETLGREISVKADRPQTAFRKLRQEYIAMGYGVDPQQAVELSQSKDM